MSDKQKPIVEFVDVDFDADEQQRIDAELAAAADGQAAPADPNDDEYFRGRTQAAADIKRIFVDEQIESMEKRIEAERPSDFTRRTFDNFADEYRAFAELSDASMSAIAWMLVKNGIPYENLRCPTQHVEPRKKLSGFDKTRALDDVWPLRPPGPCLQVYSRDDVASAGAAIDEINDSDSRSRTKALLKKLIERGEWREYTTAEPGWRGALRLLSDNHPNFSKYIKFVAGQYALAERGGTHAQVYIPPSLFVGPPGIGKSYFAERFAAALAAPLHTFRMESAQSSGPLGGSDEFWSNTRQGKVFDALVNGQVADPIFFVDELDKNTTDRFDPTGPLLTLLETDTARVFCDSSVPKIKLDASHIRWICAANDLDKISPPLLSRLRVFEIEPPTYEESVEMCRRMADRLRKSQGRGLADIEIDEDVFFALAELSPREAQRALREAFGNALFDGREVVRLRDLDGIGNVSKSKKRMGFV